MLCIVGKKFMLAALLMLPMTLGWTRASAATLGCPASAPPEWKAGNARLDRVRMFAYLPGGRNGAKAMQEGVPDEEWQTGSALFQSWNLKKGPRARTYQVDCLYTGTSRIVRFDPRSAGRCIAKRPIFRDALMPGALAFRCR